MKIIIAIVVTFFICAGQYLLSTRKKAFWGGILPILWIVFVVTMSIIKETFLKNMMFQSFIMLFILLCMWDEGRKKVKSDQQKELDKMKAKDL